MPALRCDKVRESHQIAAIELKAEAHSNRSSFSLKEWSNLLKRETTVLIPLLRIARSATRLWVMPQSINRTTLSGQFAAKAVPILFPVCQPNTCAFGIPRASIVSTTLRARSSNRIPSGAGSEFPNPNVSGAMQRKCDDRSVWSFQYSREERGPWCRRRAEGTARNVVNGPLDIDISSRWLFSGADGLLSARPHILPSESIAASQWLEPESTGPSVLCDRFFSYGSHLSHHRGAARGSSGARHPPPFPFP